MNNKILIGSIIAIAILIIASFPTVWSNEGKPDLIIEDIKVWPSTMPYRYEIGCVVKNIGDVSSEGTIELRVVVKHMLFGLIPTITVRTFKLGHTIGIEPGEAEDLCFAECEQLPIFGFYKFFCTVNPDQTIDEEYYFNNHHSETFLVIFSIFYERKMIPISLS